MSAHNHPSKGSPPHVQTDCTGSHPQLRPVTRQSRVSFTPYSHLTWEERSSRICDLLAIAIIRFLKEEDAKKAAVSPPTPTPPVTIADLADNPTDRKILTLLEAGVSSRAIEFATALGVSPVALKPNLTRLRKKGWIAVTGETRAATYTLTPEARAQLAVRAETAAPAQAPVEPATPIEVADLVDDPEMKNILRYVAGNVMASPKGMRRDLDLSQSTVKRRLRELRRRGLVSAAGRGKRALYEIAPGIDPKLRP